MDQYIIFEGKVLDAAFEYEIFTPNPNLGWDIKEYGRNGLIRTYHNVTEFHWLCSENMSAYESDIHSSGSCWYKDDALLVVVEPAEKVHKTF